MKSSLTIEKKVNVAVIGASGHASVELIKLLAGHPRINISALATGNPQSAGKHIAEVRAELRDVIDLICESLQPGEIADRCDIAIATTPAKESLDYIPGIIAGGRKCIDLSGAYRLHDASVFKQHYDFEHSDPENLQHAVYGLPELFRERIRNAT